MKDVSVLLIRPEQETLWVVARLPSNTFTKDDRNELRTSLLGYDIKFFDVTLLLGYPEDSLQIALLFPKYIFTLPERYEIFASTRRVVGCLIEKKPLAHADLRGFLGDLGITQMFQQSHSREKWEVSYARS